MIQNRIKYIYSELKKRGTFNKIIKKADNDLQEGDLIFDKTSYSYKLGFVINPNSLDTAPTEEAIIAYYDMRKGFNTRGSNSIIKLNKDNFKLGDIRFNKKYNTLEANIIIVDNNNKFLDVYERIFIDNNDTEKGIIDSKWDILMSVKNDYFKTASLDNKTLGEEIEDYGWTEEQLEQDGFDLYINTDDKKILVSLGDWSKIPSDDIDEIISNIFKGYKIDVDYEAGKSEEDGYEKINLKDKLNKYIKAEKITYDPKVNTNTSPERHTTKDYLTLQERNRDKQKSKLFDRSTMPDDAGDGYDMGNRFEDSDKTIISPTAESI